MSDQNAEQQHNARHSADLIVSNARIFAGRPGFQESLAVRDGRFVAVGTEAEVAVLRRPETTVIDAGGRILIPGLHDSHIHLIRGGLNYTLELRWDGVPSLADGLRMLRAVPEERIKQIEAVLTVVGGKVVYAQEEFVSLAPPPVPVLPEWSPVGKYGGYGSSLAAVRQHAHSHACNHLARDLKRSRRQRSQSGLWGPGCDCWAF